MNNHLYKKIIYSISKEIKRILNEDIQNFNIADYQEDSDIFDHETVANITKPKDIEEEEEFFKMTEPSENSLQLAKQMKNKIESIFRPLSEIIIPDKCLEANHYLFYLKGYFFAVSSTFKNNIIGNSWNCAVIDFNYEIAYNEFILVMDVDNLAKLIEFCNIYNNYIDFCFKGYEDYYNQFQFYVQDKLHFTTEVENEFIYAGNGYISDNEINYMDNIFEKICDIFKEFVNFIPIYINKFK